MCAIFGSKTFETFNSLYQANLNRGQSAFGMIGRRHATSYSVVHGFKTPGQVKLTKPEELPADAATFLVNTVDINDDYYVGHTQAPTSSAQTFNSKTSHPFMCHDWVVAHNGVLTNYNALVEGLDKIKYPHNIVDSSAIPALLQCTQQSDNKGAPALSEVQVITTVLSRLEGTHSTWIYNWQSSAFYLARCGSTLFANTETGDFSSLQQPGMQELCDGTLYKYSNGRLINVGTFKSQSPFFII